MCPGFLFYSFHDPMTVSDHVTTAIYNLPHCILVTHGHRWEGKTLGEDGVRVNSRGKGLVVGQPDQDDDTEDKCDTQQNQEPQTPAESI